MRAVKCEVCGKIVYVYRISQRFIKHCNFTQIISDSNVVRRNSLKGYVITDGNLTIPDNKIEEKNAISELCTLCMKTKEICDCVEVEES